MSARSHENLAMPEETTGETVLSGERGISVELDLNAGRARLLHAVEKVPLRYAPFWDRVAELWSLPLPAVAEALALSADRSRWRRIGRGFRYFDLDIEPRSGARSRLLEFAPGFRFPRHVHDGPERACVLSGSYVDCVGRRLAAGDVQHMEPGSVHALTVDSHEACVLAIQQPSIRFTAAALRPLNRWLRVR